ncbi:DNA polymerase III subunit delta [Candidatus Pantoea carbekii]|uniref:DNA polymerase III subunit delta n=1 Tax=Candidatus Pantoea carbekii TaxID=1235990 RepID=UPI0006187833|nr:DNA polymerase III subunit delta [Candidatus Pantoea carbekii]AKC32207.1 DNA polymerase III delta subunit HolA [Candidatus Pantoea carbekii]
MITIYSEELKKQLSQKLFSCYFLIGNESLLIQESIDMIVFYALNYGFEEHLRITLNLQTDWDMLFFKFQSLNLFNQRTILTLQFPINGLNRTISEQLVKLTSLLHNDILLLLNINKLSKKQENTIWFKKLSTQAVLVFCHPPEPTELFHWIMKRIKKMGLVIEDSAVKLLCYLYEGNLLGLSVVLTHLSLLWPNKTLTIKEIKNVANNTENFTPFDWINAILEGQSKKTLLILYYLKKENIEIVLLFRILQQDLLTLLYLKRNKNKQSLFKRMELHNVWKNRRSAFIKALQRLNYFQLQKAIHLLAQLELSLKQHSNQNFWLELEKLSLILCHGDFPMSFTND